MDKPIPMTPRIIRGQRGLRRSPEGPGGVWGHHRSVAFGNEGRRARLPRRGASQARGGAGACTGETRTGNHVPARPRNVGVLLQDSGVQVGEEPRTTPAAASYFRDLVAVQAPVGDPGERRRGKAGPARQRDERRPGTARRHVRRPRHQHVHPPAYGERWIDKEMAGRPFANAVATMPLPATGKQLDMPKVATAPAAAVQAAEADPVNEVNFDGETISTPKVLIAGQNDLSIQAYEFADPGMDTVIMRELTKSYNSVLDTQMLTGTGANGQHDGLKNVANINSITYSAVGSAGGADGLVGAIYDAVSQIATNAPGYMADAVVMHPGGHGSPPTATPTAACSSRARSRSHPAPRTTASLSRLPVGVILDPNITTVQGSGTNEDELYVVVTDELILAEGDLRARVLTEVLSERCRFACSCTRSARSCPTEGQDDLPHQRRRTGSPELPVVTSQSDLETPNRGSLCELRKGDRECSTDTRQRN